MALLKGSMSHIYCTLLMKLLRFGSGVGSVGRAVASDSRGPRFESNHRQKFKVNNYCQLYRKDENQEIEAGNGPFLNCDGT